MECISSNNIAIVDLQEHQSIRAKLNVPDLQVSVFCPNCGLKKKVTDINGEYQKLYRLKQGMKCTRCSTVGFRLSLKTSLDSEKT